MTDFKRLARTAIRNLRAYSSARMEVMEQGTLLNANENPWDRSIELSTQLLLNRYGEQQPSTLIKVLADLYQVKPTQCLITRGSDEGIDLLIRSFCEAGQDAILQCEPTYGMYRVAADIQGAAVHSVLLDSEDFSLDVPTVLAKWQTHMKLIFFCSPNNPTANVFATDAVLKLCETLHDQALIIVDEAYIEFAESPSLTHYLDQHPNLVILRTLSKAYGLASARCGTVLAHPDLIRLLQTVLAPYPIPSLVIAQVQQHLLDNKAELDQQLKTIKNERIRLLTAINDLPLVQHVWPSETNFILVKVKNAKDMVQQCQQQGILVRDRSHEPLLDNCIRISIGTEEQNDRLLEVLG